MLDKPLLSIVIPTKDRYVYIKVCVLTLLELKKKYANIEIVVQDNTKDNTEFLMFLEQEKLDQIMYYHTREVLSVVDNFLLRYKNLQFHTYIFPYILIAFYFGLVYAKGMDSCIE